MTKEEALKLALEALEEPKEHFAKHRRLEAITAIKEALAQPEQELVCVCGAVWEGQELVSTPPQRTWVGLTDDDLRQIILVAIGVAEAKLKEKNT